MRGVPLPAKARWTTGKPCPALCCPGWLEIRLTRWWLHSASVLVLASLVAPVGCMFGKGTVVVADTHRPVLHKDH